MICEGEVNKREVRGRGIFPIFYHSYGPLQIVLIKVLSLYIPVSSFLCWLLGSMELPSTIQGVLLVLLATRCKMYGAISVQKEATTFSVSLEKNKSNLPFIHVHR